MAEIKINVPDGYTMVKIDDSHYELQKIDNRSKSWEEYKEHTSFVNTNPFCIAEKLYGSYVLNAFHKLLCLRREWIGSWEPNWTHSTPKYLVSVWTTEIKVSETINKKEVLSFPTRSMAEEFKNTFGDLLEAAKDLI